MPSAAGDPERAAVEAAVAALAHLSTLQLSVGTMQPVLAAYALLLASAAPSGGAQDAACDGAQDSKPSLRIGETPVAPQSWVPGVPGVPGLVGLSAELHVLVFEFCSTQSLALLERSCHWPCTVAARQRYKR
jgi:hypothetical protein